MCPLGILSNYNFLRDCAGDRATAWHCSNVHTCWKPYKALRCRLPFISIFSLVLFAIDSFPLKVKDYVCPALSLIFEPVSVFFQFISFYIIKQLFNWSVVFCRGIVVDQIRDLFAGLSWLFSPGECLNVSTVTLTSVPLRPGDGITSQQAGSSSGAIVPVSPPALSPPLRTQWDTFSEYSQNTCSRKTEKNAVFSATMVSINLNVTGFTCK